MLDGLSKSDREMLDAELDYYQIVQKSEVVELQWDSNAKGNGIVISDNGKTIGKNGPQGWNAAVLGTVSVPSYSVKILQRSVRGTIMIGMAPNTVQLNGSNFSSCGWYFYVNDGTLHSQVGDSHRAYTTTIQQNSVVTVNHDTQNRTISFSIDGQDRGIAFRNIPTDLVLFPCVNFHDVDSVVGLVEQ